MDMWVTALRTPAVYHLPDYRCDGRGCVNFLSSGHMVGELPGQRHNLSQGTRTLLAILKWQFPCMQ